MIPNNHDFLRLSNLSMVTRLIWQNPGINRAEIAEKLGLYKSSISRIVGLLIKKNLVREVGRGASARTGGPRPKQLVINESFGCILGIEIQPREYRAITAHIDGSEIIRFEGGVEDQWDLERSAKIIVDEIMMKLSHLDMPVMGISFCVPGFINPRKGSIVYTCPFKLENYPFAEQMEKHFSVPVFIENDANSYAYSHLNKNYDDENFIYFLGKFHQHPEGFDIPYSVGVGLGIVLGSSIYYGSNYAAGEFLSTFRMTKEYFDNHPVNILGKPDTILADAWHNPEIMREIFEEVVMNIPSLLASLNPAKVFIGGDFLKYKDLMVQEIESARKRSKWEQMKFFLPEIEFTDFDGYGGARGAIDLLTSEIFQVPFAYGKARKNKLDWYTIFDSYMNMPSPNCWSA